MDNRLEKLKMIGNEKILTDFNLKVYDQLDDFASEVLRPEKLIDYVSARREYLFDSEESVKKYFTEDDLEGEKINTFGDFYYHYLVKYSHGYLYKFGGKGFTDGLKNLVKEEGIDLEDLDINWENIKKKEDFYEESLIDILYSILSYELNKKGYEIFGINMGYESVIYYVVTQDVYDRINKDSELFRIFDLSLLEGIYDEIYEVEEDINSELVEVGDFLEKKVDGYHTLKVDKNYNTLIENVDEDKLKIIL